GDMVRHGVRESVGRLEYLVPTTTQTVLILCVMSVLSILLIDYLYKKRGCD
ncbi:MAG: ABC transporter permease, partial [Angelakisella sp.]|nr:ABC transporter permease [Angelakisella sp.]